MAQYNQKVLAAIVKEEKAIINGEVSPFYHVTSIQNCWIGVNEEDGTFYPHFPTRKRSYDNIDEARKVYKDAVLYLVARGYGGNRTLRNTVRDKNGEIVSCRICFDICDMPNDGWHDDRYYIDTITKLTAQAKGFNAPVLVEEGDIKLLSFQLIFNKVKRGDITGSAEEFDF